MHGPLTKSPEVRITLNYRTDIATPRIGDDTDSTIS